jgi:autotransporter-associated beta strand protein
MVMVTNQNATLSAVLAGSQGLVKGGAGTLVLSGANTFTGGLTVNAGTVSVSSWNTKANAQPIGRGDITLGGGLLLFNSSSLAGADQVFTLLPGTTSTISISQSGSADGGLNDTTGRITGSGNLNLNAAAGADSKTRLLVNGANDFTGTLTINAGTLQVNDTSIGNSAPIVINSLGTLSVMSTTGTATRSLGSLSGTGKLQACYRYDTALSIGDLNTDTTFSGVISEYRYSSYTPSTSVIKTGTGNLILSGANTCTGPTTISQGSL